MVRFAVALPLLLGSCQDETLSGYVGETGKWQLVEVNGVPFSASATLDVREEGRVSGTARCSRYSAIQLAPYPWFELGPIISTKRACPELADEATFFAVLQSTTISEVSGDALSLSNDAGDQMVFTAATW